MKILFPLDIASFNLWVRDVGPQKTVMTKKTLPIGNSVISIHIYISNEYASKLCIFKDTMYYLLKATLCDQIRT